MPIIPSVTSSLTRGLTQDLFKSTGPTAVSNSKSLDFDGSNDRLTFATPSAFSGESLDNFNCTLSGWVNFNSIVQYGAIISLGPADFSISPLMSGSDVGIWLQDTALTSAGTHDPSTGTWYHYVATKSGTTYKFYANGSLLGTATDTDSATIGAESYIGNNGFGSYLNGNVDEIAVWNSTLSDDEVAALYNNGTPTDLSKDGGGYTSSSGLQLWYRMGDATEPDADGTSDLIFDQQDKTLGSELVTNGAFSSDVSGWTKDGDAASTIEYDSGRLKVTAATNYDGASQSVSGLVAGQTYKFSADYELGTATQLQIRAGSEPSTDISSPSSGTAVNYFTASATSMTVYVRTGGSTGTIFFDNVSVKKVNGAPATMSTNMDSGDIVQYTPNSYILSDLGITPDLAVSMTRKLVSDYAGSFYATSGSDVTTIYDQSGNSRNLTNNSGSGLTPATLSGSGNSARAVFSSSANTVLSSGTAGGSYAAGNHDVFIVFDPVGTDQQVIFGEGTASANLIAMDNGAFSDAIAGITLGEIRVNDAILPATVNRNALWDKMTVSGTMGGLNVLSFEDVDLSSIDGNVSLGADHNTWRLEGYFAEFIITPPLTDAEHSAIVDNIRAHYDAP